MRTVAEEMAERGWDLQSFDEIDAELQRLWSSAMAQAVQDSWQKVSDGPYYPRCDKCGGSGMASPTAMTEGTKEDILKGMGRAGLLGGPDAP